jgi:hypothetical protein
LVKDSAGLTSTATALTIQPTAALLATSSAGNITVIGGTTNVTVSAIGGTSPYTGIGNFAKVSAGTYNYTVTDAAGCTSITSITITQPALARVSTAGNISTKITDSISPNSMSNSNLNQSISLKINSYPNPSTTEFNLLIKDNSIETVDISVLSADGMVVVGIKGFSNKLYKFGNNFLPGIYILKVRRGKDIQTIKLLKSTI